MTDIILQKKRAFDAEGFDRKFNLVHIPTIDRVRKTPQGYVIDDCPCEFCVIYRAPTGLMV